MNDSDLIKVICSQCNGKGFIEPCGTNPRTACTCSARGYFYQLPSEEKK